MSGVRIASLYGFYPHKLGFCGPQEKAAKKLLFNYLSGKKTPESTIRKILKGFKGAFPYYQLIAKSNKIKDPLDEKVVKAYWVGNELLEKVSLASLKEMVVNEFSKPGLLSREIAEKKSKEIPDYSKPHHSFHVLAIGSVTGSIVLEGELLDFCRVGWGQVVDIKKEKDEDGVVIDYLGKAVTKLIYWDKSIIPDIKLGDIVSTHWNHVIQILDEEDLNNLKKYQHNPF